MKNMVVVTTLMVLSSGSFAMQAMDDEALAQQTGQDGLTVKVSASTIKFDQVSIIDTDGAASIVDTNNASTHANAAALVIASSNTTNPAANPVTVQFLNANGQATANTLTATIDTDGGTNSSGSDAFANIGLAFDSNLKKINISPLSVYLAKPAGTVGNIGATGNVFQSSGGLRTDVTQLLSLGAGATVNLTDGKPLAINIQLGNAPQSRMFLLGGSIDSIDIPNIELFSKGDTTSSLNINGLQLKAHDSAGFSLGGFYGGVESDGFVFGSVGTTDKFDVTINSIVAGSATATPTDAFNGLKNGSMGGFGLIGASVTNLKVNVKGM